MRKPYFLFILSTFVFLASCGLDSGDSADRYSMKTYKDKKVSSDTLDGVWLKITHSEGNRIVDGQPFSIVIKQKEIVRIESMGSNQEVKIRVTGFLVPVTYIVSGNAIVEDDDPGQSRYKAVDKTDKRKFSSQPAFSRLPRTLSLEDSIFSMFNAKCLMTAIFSAAKPSLILDSSSLKITSKVQ